MPPPEAAPRQHLSRARFGAASGSLLVRQLAGCCSLLSQFGSRRASRRRKGDEYRIGGGAAKFTNVRFALVRAMASVPHEFVTVDMLGLKGALIKRSRSDRVSVSSLVRAFVARGWDSKPQVPRYALLAPVHAAKVKVSIGMTSAEARQFVGADRDLSHRGCVQNLGLVYAAMPRLSRYSSGLREPRGILIRFLLYQRM